MERGQRPCGMLRSCGGNAFLTLTELLREASQPGYRRGPELRPRPFIMLSVSDGPFIGQTLEESVIDIADALRTRAAQMIRIVIEDNAVPLHITAVVVAKSRQRINDGSVVFGCGGVEHAASERLTSRYRCP